MKKERYFKILNIRNYLSLYHFDQDKTYRMEKHDGNTVLLDDGKDRFVWFYIDDIKEVIGYKLKNEEYYDPADRILEGNLSLPQGVNKMVFHIDSAEYNHFRRLCVLDLWFEPVYKEEKPEVRIGTWYKSKDYQNKTLLYCVIEIDEDGEIYGYGFSQDGFIGNYECNIWGNVKDSDYELANSKEVKDALIKESQKRNLVDGVRIKSPFKNWVKINNLIKSDQGDFIEYEFKDKEFLAFGVLVFKDGIWAEPFEKKEKDCVHPLNDLQFNSDGDITCKLCGGEFNQF